MSLEIGIGFCSVGALLLMSLNPGSITRELENLVIVWIVEPLNLKC